MGFRTFVRNLPLRASTGAYILHTGIEKWSGGPEQAQFVHGAATGTYPFLKDVEPATFLKMLAVGEIAVGSALLLPFVPRFIAGLGLAGFAGSLLNMYWHTESMRKPNSIWPSQQGTAVSKDIWMFGIGTGLMVDAIVHPRD